MSGGGNIGRGKKNVSFIILAGAALRLSGMTFDAGRHSWAGISTYEKIYDDAVSGREVDYKLSLQFYSPTTFRARGINYPLFLCRCGV
jgi:CRISPR-associated endoribonuclease Cas6